jgi:ferrochelatase
MRGVVVMAYGTPASREDVLDYYTDIRRGRPPTEEQLADLVRRYDAIAQPGHDGLSPLREHTERQRDRIAAALGRDFVVEIGLKHADPRIEDAVMRLATNGAEWVVGLVLAPHYSSMSIGDYLERAGRMADANDVGFSGIESWATEPAFVDFLATDVRSQLAGMPKSTAVVFTAHSLPERILVEGDPYPHEVEATAKAVAAAAGIADDQWSVAWQSAGRTPEPWIGPDILTVIDRLAGSGRGGVLVCPCGFVADHLEVLYDLDIEAARRAEEADVAFARTRSVNDDPTVMSALARLVANA